SIDTTQGGSTDKGISQSVSISVPISAGVTVRVAYLTAAQFTQVPWICKQNGQNVIMTTDMADLSSSKTSTTSLVFLTSDQTPNYYQFDDNFLTTASSTNSITSDTVVLVNQETAGTSGGGITGGKLLIMSSTNYEVWLTGFGAMYVKKKDVGGKIGQILWNTHTNVKRTTDQVVNGVLFNKGSTRLLIDDLGHILIQVDNMFNNIGVTPYNISTYDPNTRQTTFDTFTTVWSNVPKHMMFQIGTKRNGYTFVLEEFPATSGTTWNLILYDGGGSKIWCATSSNCNWSGSTGYRFPRAYLLPTDFPTDAVDPQQDDASYPHNYLNPAYNLTVINPAIHISENQRCGPILTSGQGITSPNGRFKLILDWSGNLIFKDGVRTMWETFTANVFFAQPPYQLQLSNRGSLYLSDKFGGLMATTLVQNSIVRNSFLNITDQGELQIFGTDGRQIWTSFELINPGMSGWKAWNARKTFCYPGCKTLTLGDCVLFENDPSKVVGGMILTLSGTGRLSYIDANASVAAWQVGTFLTGVEPFSLGVESGLLTIRDATGNVTSTHSCSCIVENGFPAGTTVTGCPFKSPNVNIAKLSTPVYLAAKQAPTFTLEVDGGDGHGQALMYQFSGSNNFNPTYLNDGSFTLTRAGT
ncbi:hypothetical protein HDU76_008935, partial [Blyttiomyces sp. JEL0837]